MKNKKTIIAVISIGVLATILFLNSQITGFATLRNDENSALSAKISSSLSVQAVKQTKLKASLIKSSIEQCPSVMQLSFSVKNSGNAIAERLFVKASESLKIVECINCNAFSLQPKEEIIVKLKACKLSSEKATVSFYSINSPEETIQIQ